MELITVYGCFFKTNILGTVQKSFFGVLKNMDMDKRSIRSCWSQNVKRSPVSVSVSTLVKWLGMICNLPKKRPQGLTYPWAWEHIHIGITSPQGLNNKSIWTLHQTYSTWVQTWSTLFGKRNCDAYPPFSQKRKREDKILQISTQNWIPEKQLKTSLVTTTQSHRGLTQVNFAHSSVGNCQKIITTNEQPACVAFEKKESSQVLLLFNWKWMQCLSQFSGDRRLPQAVRYSTIHSSLGHSLLTYFSVVLGLKMFANDACTCTISLSWDFFQPLWDS